MVNAIKKIKAVSCNFYQRLFRFIMLFLGDLKSEYRFSLNDRFIGAKVFVYGYAGSVRESVDSLDEKFDCVTLKQYKIVVPKKIFRPGELGYIYNETLLPFMINPHCYETDFIKVSRGDVVLDAGACEGIFSLHALNNGADIVYMFEPAKVLCEGLQKTFEDRKNVFLINKALSDTPGLLKFKTDEEYICMAKLDERGSDLIGVTTVDDFVAANKISKIDFIKSDVEGAEVDLIKGAIKTLKQFKPKLSIAVYHKYENAMLIKSLILQTCPEYKIKFGGCYMFEKPYRPYMLYAYV